MGLTVRTLIEDPLIRTRVLAGESGVDGPVTWAHTCEVEDPWNWLGPNELLMTDGYSFPADAEGQVDFIRHLAGANLAGLALAEGFVAPALTDEAVRVADELGFPVLQTARAVPFVTIARAAGEAQQTSSSSTATRLLRLYDVLRRTRIEEREEALLVLMGRELKAVAHVVELGQGRELLPSSERLPEPLRRAILDKAAEQGGQLAAFNRVEDEDGTALLVPLGSSTSAALLIRPDSQGDPPDILIAQHAAVIAELEVALIAARHTRARARGAELLRQMLAASIDPDAAARQMRALRLGTGPWTVTVWLLPDEAGVPGNALVDALTWAPWPYLAALVDGLYVIVVQQEQLERGLGLGHLPAVMGASQPISAPARFADAYREARWALDSAQASGAKSAVYDAHGSFFMPKTLAEGELAVRRLLGVVLDYDEAHDAQLMRSLWAYFEANRSWVAGSRVLGIHKQTLVYRIRKVEELTGMDLRDFGTQAELYLALRTWWLLGAHEGGDPGRPLGS